METETPAIGISKQIVGTPLPGVFVYMYIQTQEISVYVYFTTIIQSPVLTSDLLLALYIYYHGPLNHFHMLQ